MSLNQQTIDTSCAAAQARYTQMTVKDAKRQIAYEMQGFLAAMETKKEWPLPQGLYKLIEMIGLIASANGICRPAILFKERLEREEDDDGEQDPKPPTA